MSDRRRKKSWLVTPPASEFSMKFLVYQHIMDKKKSAENAMLTRYCPSDHIELHP